MTRQGTGKYNVKRETKPCVHCTVEYEGTVLSRYCSDRCKQAYKHRARMADPERKARARQRMDKAQATYFSRVGSQYVPVASRTPEQVATKRAAARRYIARKRNAFTIPYTAEQLESKVSYWGDRCWICQTDSWTQIDHVKPLAKGGPDMLANLRPACSACNQSKRDKWPFPA